jgi:tetratricopeptide (TPR) repeat protein
LNFEEHIEQGTNAVYEKRYEDALEPFLEALKIEPHNKKIMYNIGVCYIHLKKYYLAIDILKKALSYDKDYYNANSNLAVAYKKIGHYDKALTHLMRLYKKHPDDTDILFNLANTLSSLEEYQEAYNMYQKIIQSDPDNYKAYYGIGLLYNSLLEYDKAKKYFNKTIQLNPSYPDAFFALSLIQLRSKEYKEGWINYEARWKANNPLKELSYGTPMYNGESLEGKNILIQEEQGFGDNIQFIRYLDEIKKKNPKNIYFALREPLRKVFEKIDGITIVGDKEIVEDIDYTLSLLSAPRIFNTTFETIPNTTPYLPSVKKNLKKELKKALQTKKLKVGFSFAGNPEHSNDYYRSIHFEVFSSLFNNKNIEFYSLQIDYIPKNFATTIKSYPNVTDLKEYINDFYDTANILNHLDVVISIDSALAHFAGAYNKKTFLLLPKNAEWRWFEDLDTSPWYPSMKLFRQNVLGSWGDVLIECAQELDSLTLE